MDGTGLICLAHRVCTEVGNAPLHDGLVFFWSSCPSIVGCEFRKIRPGDDHRNAAVRVECYLTLRIGTKQIRLLAVLLKRDRNQLPRSYEVFGRRLRDRLLTRQRNSEINADAATKTKMRRFIVILLMVGGCRVVAWRSGGTHVGRRVAYHNSSWALSAIV